jgi:radical SAM protein with 4Fe4S-binding SPASM domain
MQPVNPNATYKEIQFQSRPEWEKGKSKAYWDYRRKWQEYPQQQIVGPFPIHLDIETTNACNLRCPMCPRTVLLQQNRFFRVQFMDFDFYRSLIDQGVEHGLSSVKLNYLGEPLLHPDVVRQVKYAKDRGLVDVMFNTNGTLLTEELSRQLLGAGLDKIFFSFDAHRKEEYEKIRVGANFEKTVENIQTFARLKKSNGHGQTETRVSMVLHRNEEEKFQALVAMWQGTVDTIGFGYYVERNPEKIKEQKPVEGFICAQPWQRMFVMADGTVTACCVDERREYVLGNARKEKLADIWGGEPARCLREAHGKGQYSRIAMCRKCYVPIAEEEDRRAGKA